jgi:hypothetical protein
MLETITIDKALSKGHKMVTYPGMLLMFGILGLTFLLGFQNENRLWIWPVGITSSIILPWIFWSVRITKWKVWAFDNVRNVHELKKRAIQEKLIWPDSSLLKKTEIWNSEDKQKWESLQDKFQRKDEIIYKDDLTVPTEKIIFYSKRKNLIEMIVMVGCLAVGVYLIVKSNSYILGTILSVIGGYFAFKEFKQVTNKTPQIILNHKGIETINTKFYSWHDITNEEVDIEGSGKHTHYFLTYEHPDGLESLLIDDYDIEYKELKRLLRIYKGRSITKNKYL